MKKYHVELTDVEAALVAQVDFRTDHRNHDEGHCAYNKNKTFIHAVLKSIGARGGFPEIRMKYWSDPAYQQGRLKASHKGLFERNNCRDTAIYEHPHFLKYLRYFLYGADLPNEVVSFFEDKVGNPEWVTSSDIVPIGKIARHLTRESQLTPSHAAEEFFKLCLDMNLGLNIATSIKRSVQQMQ